MSFIAFSSGARDRVRQDRQHARALDGGRDLALVERAVAAVPPRDDLAALGQEVLELPLVLVVDLERLVGAEAAHLAPPEAAPAAAHLVAAAAPAAAALPAAPAAPAIAAAAATTVAAAPTAAVAA